MQSETDLVVVNSTEKLNSTLEALIPLIEKLPLDDRLLLLERLIGKQSGLSVVFGNNQLSGSVIVQINQMSPDQLGDILQAIADRIRGDRD